MSQDTDATEGELSGPFDAAVLEGLQHDRHHHGTGGGGWDGLLANVALDEDGTIAIPFTSGTTSRPKGVIYTHRGAYLAALANVIESGLNCGDGHAGTAPLSESTGGGSSVPREGLVERCRYLWTLPMFHAMGWTFPWAITAVRGTHVCLRRIDYPLIWRLLREEDVTHFNAAPTVNTLLCSAAEAARLPRPVRVTVAASPPTATLFERMTTLNLHPVHVYGLTETYGPITKSYYMPAWDALKKPHERFAKMARQGHGFITSLPVRVVRTPKEDEHDGDEKEKEDVAADDVLVDVRKDGKEIGEIVFFGNICTKGYYKDPAATRKLFAGGGLHSGDLAVWHPDGSVQILDRAKDIIISGRSSTSQPVESVVMP